MISTFSPNCTFPDHSVNYVGSPPLRSTLGIVWPCVTALIASIYTALHLDVIVVRSETKKGKRSCNWCSRLFDRACRKMRAPLVGLSIATIALFAPELIAQRSIMEWWWCRSALKRISNIENMSDEVKSQWTRTHCYYVNMGGFRLRCRGILAGHNKSPGALCDCEETVMDLNLILEAMDCGMLPQEPQITKEEILDKSKTNIFARITAIWQIVWFVIDVVTRLARGRPIAQLEVGVAGFAMLAIVTLCSYFGKPKGVNVATQVSFQILPEYESWYLRTLERKPHDPSLDFLWREPCEGFPDQKIRHNFGLVVLWFNVRGDETTSRSQTFLKEVMAHISVERDEDEIYGIFASLLLAGVFALPFGAVHVAAWNAEFPTVVDQYLWRISSLVSTVVLLSIALAWSPAFVAHKLWYDTLGRNIKSRIILFLVEASSRLAKAWQPYAVVVSAVAAICYIIARGILIVEMVRCMLFLPPEAYVTSWTTNVPHFG